jgi:serine/threonine protein kinase/Tol biopolymer transport system component
MDHKLWKRVEEIYHQAAARDVADRAAFLDAACSGDAAVRREVESLLAQEGAASRFFAAPAVEAVANMLTDDTGTSIVGRRIGSYEITGFLGAGGMGEVYRARDAKLGREVAIKVLPRIFTGDPDRLSRFEREARILAAINHPHIATIHGLEELDGVRGLVMELVDGPTLADRLARGKLTVTETMTVMRQVADALDAAHEKGIIHRDLKPANIKLTGDGRAKVLDFGVAKAFARDGGEGNPSETPTFTDTGLHPGAIVGTPAYMSPEQARGHAVDKRTDIWSFGCVLYELLTGRAPFAGATTSDLIAAILEREPDWTVLAPTGPQSVQRLVKKCLEKDPRRRLRDIGDARIELEDALAGTTRDDAVRRQPLVTRRAAISAVAGAVAGAASVGIFGSSRYRGAIRRNLMRFAIPMPEGRFHQPSFNGRVAISPDGTRIAFNANGPTGPTATLFTRSLNELESKVVKELAGGGGAGPFFSPDGRWVGFLQTGGGPGGGDLRKLALSGGAPVTVCDIDNFLGATWADDDTIYFVPEFPSGVARVSALGGQPHEIVSIDFAGGERQHRYPCALPGGNGVMFTTTTPDIASFDDARIVAFSPASGQKKVLVEGGTQPRYSPSGHLLYARDGKIYAVGLDVKRLETVGQPVAVLDGVLMSRNTGSANYDVSASGDLVYIPGICDGGARTLVWVDRNGRAETLPLAAKSYLHPRLSPDDRRLAIEIEGPSHDLYVYEFDRGVLTNITTDGVSHWPVWAPDGAQLGYRSGRMSRFRLWSVPADRSRSPRQLPADGTSQSAESWSPDGRAIAYTTISPGVPASIMVARLDGGTPEVFAKGKGAAGSSKFSPDGRWIAYCSTESGKAQVYVQAFPGPGPKIQISNDGGTDPVWRRSGGELFYRNGDSMMVVAVATAPTFTAGRPAELWRGHYSHGMSSSCGAPGATSSNYDVTADGQRFLMIKDDDQDSTISREVIVVLGFAEEVIRLSGKA